MLNILDHQMIRDRASMAQDHIDKIEVDEESMENRAIENSRQLLTRILEEIRDS